MSTTNPTDLFLVNRSDVSYYVTQANLMAQIKDTDLMLINRDDVSYKITGVDVKKSLVDPIELTVTLAPTLPVVGTVETATAIVGGGKEPDSGYVFAYQWSTATDATGTGKVNINNATNSTYTPVQSDADKYLGCTVTTADAFGTAASTTTYAGPVDPGEKEPDITSVVLTEADATDNDRFTSSLFPYTVDMSEEGKPDPTYALKAKLTGATFDFGVKSSTITGVADTSIPGGWTTTTSVLDGSLRAITYADGKFVAVSNAGTGRAMYSADGISWTLGTGTTNESWRAVAYGDGKFLAVATGASGSTSGMYSTDGISWALSNIGQAAWSGVVYGSDKFVAVSTDGTVKYSTDGISNWQTVAGLSPIGWQTVTYGNGRFVAIASTGSSNRVAYSDNGINWANVPAAEQNTWYSVTYGNGKFVAVSNNGTNRVMYSTDAVNWTAVSAPDIKYRSVTYGDGKFVAVGDAGTYYSAYSTDGINWETSTPPSGQWFAIAYGDNKFVSTALGADVMYSATATNEVKATALTCASNSNLDKLNTEGGAVFMTDGDTASDGTYAIASYQPTSSAITTAVEDPGGWNSVSVQAKQWTSVAYGADKFVVVARGGTDDVLYSADGITWQTTSSNNTDNWQSVTYGGDKFVAVAASGTNRVMYSTDGISWTGATATEANSWNSVTYGGGKFVAVSYDGTSQVMYSTDGISWTSASATEANQWWSVTYGDGKFVAVAYIGTNRVMYSTDGINWTAAATPGDNNWYSVTYGGGKFVAVATSGSGDRVMYSTDAINWTSATAAVANQWISVTYGDGKFLAVSDSTSAQANQVMWSTDAINWNTASSSEANNWESVTYGSDKFVAVSSNGTNRVMWSLTGADASTELTFADPCTDLQYFNVGDTVTANESNDLYAFLSPAFSTTLYGGNGNGTKTGGNVQFITTGVDNTSKALVWIKSTDIAYNHQLIDTQRGGINLLSSNATFAASDNNGLIQSFENNGFWLGNEQNVNYTGDNYVAWNFRGAPGFFDIVTFENDGNPIPHSLGTTPGFIITKSTSNANSWYSGHKDLPDGWGSYAVLNGSDPAYSLQGQSWDPTNSTFILPATLVTPNDGNQYVAYLFADTPNLIKCGSYTGTGAFTTVDVGFKPEFMLIKSITQNSDWGMLSANMSNKYLETNSSGTEGSVDFDFIVSPVSGVSLNELNSNFNTSGQTYIYVAIAEGANAGEFVPTGVVAEEPNTTNRTLKLNNTTGNWADSTGYNTTIPAVTAGGTWDSYTGSVANITDTTGRWIGANAGSKAFSIAPVDGITEQTAEVYCAMQIIDDKAEVMGIQTTDPGFLNVTAKDYTIEFPALFTSGEAPDTALPPGTAITATVKAENTVGASVRESNTFIPQLVAPEGSAGPITGSTETVLTVGSSANLDGFVANDSLVMVDGTGAVASYTPTTTAITNVLNNSIVGAGWTYGPDAGLFTVRGSYSLNAAGSLALVGSTNIYKTSDSGQSWSVTYTGPVGEGDSFYGFHGTSIVTVAASGQGYNPSASPSTGTQGTKGILTSTDDGSSWTVQNTPGNCNWRGVTYGNSRWIVVGESVFANENPCITAMSTTNTNATSGWGNQVSILGNPASSNESWFDIAYGVSNFVAVGPTVATTQDGISWTVKDLSAVSIKGSALGNIRAVDYIQNQFVVSANGELLISSDDGATWVSRPFPSKYYTTAAYGVSYNNGTYVIATQDGPAWSPDLINFYFSEPLTFTAVGGVVYASKFILSGGYGATAYSLDGKTPVEDYELTFTDNQDLAFLKSGDLLTSSAVTAVTPAFSTTLYSGNGSTQTITTGIDNTNKFLLWVKSRTATNYNHVLTDSTAGMNDSLASNLTDGRVEYSNAISAYTSTGFTVGSASVYNSASYTYVAWNFRAAPGFMDIVSYPAGSVVNHNLGVVPAVIIMKATEQTSNWNVYHQSLGIDDTLWLESDVAKQTNAGAYLNGQPTSTTFTLGSYTGSRPGVAYLFADTAWHD